ncbi:hypothetical protein, partial [Mesohalobacter salilacus]|uniref:hypothetical protein n=1 Tax=Mesohalobacter salilacus TaxID=2491711 RepID=UPI00403EC36C
MNLFFSGRHLAFRFNAATLSQDLFAVTYIFIVIAPVRLWWKEVQQYVFCVIAREAQRRSLPRR